MLFDQIVPAPPLDRFVDSIAYFEGYTPGHDREILIPDGAIYVIADMDETPKHLYATPYAPTGQGYRKTWISGMQARPITIEAQRGSSLLIIRFRPGGALPFLGFSAEGLAGEVEQLDAVLGQAAASLRDRALEQKTPQTRMRAATAWLLERAGGRPQGHRAVALMLGLMARRPGTRLADLCEATGYGERQVRNLFWTWVGVGPKRYQRIVRFQGVLRSLAQSGGDAAFDPWLETGRIDMPCWADVASAFGYADQSHLSADFKALAGVTPGGYVAAYRGLENYLPVHLDRKPPGVA